MLSLTQCVWEFQSNALWDTHYHILLPAAIVVRLINTARQCYCSHEISHCCKLQLLKWELPSQTSRLRGYKSLLKYPFLKFFDGLDWDSKSLYQGNSLVMQRDARDSHDIGKVMFVFICRKSLSKNTNNTRKESIFIILFLLLNFFLFVKMYAADV